MVRESETLLAILALCVLLFHIVNARRLKEIPGGLLVLAAYSSLVAGWIFTNLEELALGPAFNLLEHFGYAAGMLLVLAWCLKISGSGRRHE